MYYRPRNMWGILVVVLMLTIALPMMIKAIEGLIVPIIIIIFILAIGGLIYDRRRRWLRGKLQWRLA